MYTDQPWESCIYRIFRQGYVFHSHYLGVWTMAVYRPVDRVPQTMHQPSPWGLLCSLCFSLMAAYLLLCLSEFTHCPSFRH